MASTSYGPLNAFGFLLFAFNFPFNHMPKNYRIADLKLLLEHLSSHTGESLDHYGTGKISDRINGSVSHKYLYDNLLQPVRKASNENLSLKLAPNKVDEITRFLGHDNFNAFLAALRQPLDTASASIAGNYYSYIRKNSRDGMLLRSPVNIYIEQNKLKWLLKGPVYKYEGLLVHESSCFHCHMSSHNSGKMFYHVYKIGKSMSPAVLQGIFSGVSSANDPIGGRCLLIRQKENFDTLSNKSMSIDEMARSANPEDTKIASYFNRFEDNNLRVNNSYGFDLDDLV